MNWVGKYVGLGWHELGWEACWEMGWDELGWEMSWDELGWEIGRVGMG